MNKNKIKKTIEELLQYGWMWGWPRYVEKGGWENLKEFYKEELNNGKDFKPDENRKAQAS